MDTWTSKRFSIASSAAIRSRDVLIDTQNGFRSTIMPSLPIAWQRAARSSSWVHATRSMTSRSISVSFTKPQSKSLHLKTPNPQTPDAITQQPIDSLVDSPINSRVDSGFAATHNLPIGNLTSRSLATQSDRSKQRGGWRTETRFRLRRVDTNTYQISLKTQASRKANRSTNGGFIGLSTTRDRFYTDRGFGLVDATAAVETAIGANLPSLTNSDNDDPDLQQIRVPSVWHGGYTGQGTIVAVIDTGVDYTHFDLNDNIWRNADETLNGLDDDGNGYIDDLQGWNFVANNGDPMDDSGHGTHVAGTIAAEKNNQGMTGVAFNARIMPVKVLDHLGNGDGAIVAQGIRYAVDQGADVINLSLGGAYSSPVADAIADAAGRGAVIVLAAGNEAATVPTYPARLADRWGIAVGAVDPSDRLASFSNQAGSQPLYYVTAPGVGIDSTVPGDRFARWSGTSMAAPYVSGVAALVQGANAKLTAAQVEDILVNTANPTRR